MTLAECWVSTKATLSLSSTRWGREDIMKILGVQIRARKETSAITVIGKTDCLEKLIAFVAKHLPLTSPFFLGFIFKFPTSFWPSST